MESITVTIPAQEWNRHKYGSKFGCYLAKALKEVLENTEIEVNDTLDKDGICKGTLEVSIDHYSEVFIDQQRYITTEPYNRLLVESAFEAGNDIKVTLKKL